MGILKCPLCAQFKSWMHTFLYERQTKDPHRRPYGPPSALPVILEFYKAKAKGGIFCIVMKIHILSKQYGTPIPDEFTYQKLGFLSKKGKTMIILIWWKHTLYPPSPLLGLSEINILGNQWCQIPSVWQTMTFYWLTWLLPINSVYINNNQQKW